MALQMEFPAIVTEKDAEIINKSVDLDAVSTKKDDILEHPFLSFFLAIMDYDKQDGSAEVELFGCPKVGPREKYITGCLLTGQLNKITTRTPVDITMMIIPDENFDVTCHKNALKSRQTRYPSVASVISSAIIRVPEDTNQEKENTSQVLTPRFFTDLMTSSNLHDVLPPPFHRITPSLMPPSDDEFQFLYPSVLEPLWMETKVVQRNARTALASSSAFPGKTVEGRNKMLSEKSKSLEPDSSSPAASLSSNKDTRSFSADVARKTGSSLLDTPSAATPVKSDDKSVEQCRASSLTSLPTDKTRESDTTEELVTEGADDTTVGSDVTTSVSESLTVVSSTSSEKKQPLTSPEAAELLKKSLVSIIARNEAQKIAEAIVKDPSLAKIVDIPLNKFDKYIEDNPAIAAAVVVIRVTENFNELPQFFQLLSRMKISVQAMEVVNRLYTRVEFPQEYLNNYIATCVRRCDEPGQTLFAQGRQVRIVCVFLSSLIRNRTWDVHPLSVELQSFVLKFSHIREAASLYQAILMALQSSADSWTARSSTPSISSRTSAGAPSISTPANTIELTSANSSDHSNK